MLAVSLHSDASMKDLDEYLDMLYEDSGNHNSGKNLIIGTLKILSLCRNALNLEQLIQNNTVMGAVTRVLQEEFKKSAEVTFNVLRIFLAFSNFLEMHSLMADYKMGALTLKTIEYETKRVELLSQDIRDRQTEINHSDSSPRDLQRSNEDVANSPTRSNSKHSKDVIKLIARKHRHEKLLFVGFYILLNLAENPLVERKMTKKNLLTDLITLWDSRSLGPRVKLPDLALITCSFLRKLCVYDENVSEVVASGAVLRVSFWLQCNHQQVVNAVLRVLFALSFMSATRDQLLSGGAVPKIIALLGSPPHRARSIRLLYQLSYNDKCKAMFAEPVVESRQVSNQSTSTTTGVSLLTGLIVNFPQPQLSAELGALAVNVTLHPSCAELMATNKGIGRIIDKLTTMPASSGGDKSKNSAAHDLYIDVHLLKVLRNLSLATFNKQQQEKTKKMSGKTSAGGAVWSPHVKALVDLAVTLGAESTNTRSSDCLVEVLGILASMTPRDLPSGFTWARLLRDHGLLQLLSRLLVPGLVQADILLEAVLVLSAAAAEPQACEVIASSSVLGLSYKLFKDKLSNTSTGATIKTDDIELSLQLLHFYLRLLAVEVARDELMYSTRIVADALACMKHTHPAIRHTATLIADVVLEHERSELSTGPDVDENSGVTAFNDMAQQIIKIRFESYNSSWLAQISQISPRASGRRDGNTQSESPNKWVQSANMQIGRRYHFGEETGDSDFNNIHYYHSNADINVDHGNINESDDDVDSGDESKVNKPFDRQGGDNREGQVRVADTDNWRRIMMSNSKLSLR